LQQPIEQPAASQEPPANIQNTAKPPAFETLATASPKKLVKVTPVLEPPDPPKSITPPATVSSPDKPPQSPTGVHSLPVDKEIGFAESKSGASGGDLIEKSIRPEISLTAKKEPRPAEQKPSAPLPEPKVAIGLAERSTEPAPTKPPSSTPQRKQGDAFKDCVDCPEMVVVTIHGLETKASSSATSSSPTARIAKGFAIARNEITFEEWDKCVAALGCSVKPNDAGWGRDSRPVISVSFDDITKQYLPWLSSVTGQTYRLPTDTEWELAAGGGKEADSSVVKASTASLTVCANFRGTTGKHCAQGTDGTVPVGTFGSNSLGLTDMYGNVWEWVDDCWQPLVTTSDSAVPGQCRSHVLRGGSWSTDASVFNPSVRGWENSTGRKTSIGFRVARTLQ
jgi:formylglycine-generating enzyme required for sulfatase activity